MVYYYRVIFFYFIKILFSGFHPFKSCIWLKKLKILWQAPLTRRGKNTREELLQQPTSSQKKIASRNDPLQATFVSFEQPIPHQNFGEEERLTKRIPKTILNF